MGGCVIVLISTAAAPGTGVPSVDHQKPNIFATSGLDDFDEGQEVMETRDFADDVRRKIADEFTKQQQIGGFEVSPTAVPSRAYQLVQLFGRALMTLCVWRR